MGTGGLELGRSPNSSDKKRSYRDFQPYLWPLRRVLSDFMVYKLYMYSLCKCTNFRSSPERISRAKKRSYSDFQPYLWSLRRVLSGFYGIYMLYI